MKKLRKVVVLMIVSLLVCSNLITNTYAETTTNTVIKECVEDTTNEWNFSNDSRIIIIKDDNTIDNADLQQTVQLVNAEMEASSLIDNQLPIYVASASYIQDGDIVVTMDYDNTTSFDEEYSVSVSNYALISSSSINGILYGLRTLSERIEDNNFNYCEIVDYPDVAERSLHIDMARKYYTKDWIIDRIIQMSYLKMNTLQLHFSEDEGFRIECESHPEVMSDEYLTKDEIREIIAVAKQYGVSVIPSLDAPGHLEQALKTHEDYQLDIINDDGTLGKDAGALDISNPDAVQFMKDLYDEYAELFCDSEYFHIGADEFVTFSSIDDDCPALVTYAEELYGEGASAIDAYVYYVNDMASYLEEKGFTVRVWNDGFYRSDTKQTVELKSSIQVDYWTRMFETIAPVQTYIDKGFKVVNFCDKAEPLGSTYANMTDSFMYYVNSQYMYAHPTGENIYNYWHAGLFSNWGILNVAKQEYEAGSYPDQLLGASFAIWNDSADEEQDVTETNIYEPLLAMSQKCWNANTLDNFTDYETFVSSYKTYDEIPGYNTSLNAFVDVEIIADTDYSDLSDLVDIIDQLDSSQYTEESYAIVETALANAKEVLNNPNASQAEVDAALTALQDAYDNLVKVASDSSDATIDNTSSTTTDTSTTTTTQPQTGDNPYIFAFAVMLFVGAIGIITLKKKEE